MFELDYSLLPDLVADALHVIHAFNAEVLGFEYIAAKQLHQRDVCP